MVTFAPLKLRIEISLLNAVKISFDVKMTFEVKMNLNFKGYDEELKSCNEAMSIRSIIILTRDPTRSNENCI